MENIPILTDFSPPNEDSYFFLFLIFEIFEIRC